jgi:hypothetical protein
VLERVEVRDGRIRLPGGTVVDADHPLGTLAYEQLRSQALESETDDQTQWLFVVESRRLGRLEALEVEVGERADRSPDRPWLKALHLKARKTLGLDQAPGPK